MAMGVVVRRQSQSIVDALSRHGFEVESISGALLSAAGHADRRYVAVAVPDIRAVHRLLEALAGLEAKSVLRCPTVLFATDSTRPGVRFAVLVGLDARDRRTLH
jgi:hypothetical protein